MAYKLYVPKSVERFFYKQTRNQLIKTDLTIEKVPGGTIVIDKKNNGYGVFDNYNFVKSSTQLKTHTGQFIPKLDEINDEVSYIDTDVVFAGNQVEHFGHFLLEHMNRSYPSLDKKYKDMKYVFVNNFQFGEAPNYIYDLMGLLGIKKENIIILQETTRFKNVFVPEQGFNIPIFSSIKYGETFKKMASIIADTYNFEKIYVSRAKLEIESKTFGEEAIQKIFKKNGYHIIYPEQLPIAEQIAYIKNCKTLAGIAGTALHLALFMKPGGTVIHLKRNKIKKDNINIQYLINKTQGLDSIFISASIETKHTSHGRIAPQIIGLTPYMKKFFDDNGFKYNKEDLLPDDKAIADYNLSAAQYSGVAEKIKRTVIKIISCLVPGRIRRRDFRKWLKKILKVL